MQFVYHENAGEPFLHVEIRAYEHLFKVRRMSAGAQSLWRNMEDAFLYEYHLKEMGKKEALFERVASYEKPLLPSQVLHIGWCVIDPKIIEKTLPMLNELGVQSICFVYADFSQKNHKLDYERMRRIVINSSQQCGRSSLMHFETYENLKSYLTQYPHSMVLDFSETKMDAQMPIESIIIGPEGGWSEKERAMLLPEKVVGLTCKAILRSETAVLSVASKILA